MQGTSLCEVSTKLAQWFRRSCLKKVLTHTQTGGQTDARRMNDEQWAVTKAYCSLELKNAPIMIDDTFIQTVKRC